MRIDNAPTPLPVTSAATYGLVGDGQKVTDGAMNGTTGVLTSASGKFSAADVGKWISVTGAGAAGADLVTTVASYQSATQITLTANSGTAVSGAVVLWGTDNSTLWQNALNALMNPSSNTATGGGVLVLPPSPKPYLFGTSPGLLYRGIPNNTPLVLIGYGATIMLTQSCRQFLKFNRVADYDAFQNIAVMGFTVDGTGITTFTASQNCSMLIGSYVSNGILQRVNFKNILVRDVRGYAASSQNNLNIQRHWISFLTYQPSHGVSEPTTNTVQDIAIEDFHFEGLEQGVYIGGQGGATYTDLNIQVNNVYINRWYHDTLAVATTHLSSANVQVGSRASGGFIYIGNGHGVNSGDVGIEIDGVDYAVVENVKITDAYGPPFLGTNFVTPLHPNAQRWIFRNCMSVFNSQTNITGGFQLSNNNSLAVGRVDYINCSHHNNTGAPPPSGNPEMFYFGTLTYTAVTIENAQCIIDSPSISSGSNTHSAMNANLNTSKAALTIKGFRYVVKNGSVTGGATLNEHTFVLTSGSSSILYLYDLDFDITWTGASAFSTQLMNLAGGSTFWGIIRGFRVHNISGDTSPRGIIIGSAANLTIPSSVYLIISETDFSGLSSSVWPFFANAPDNQAHVRWIDAVNNPGYKTTATSYTAQTGIDKYIKVTASSQTITLPTAVGASDWIFEVKNASGVTPTTIATTSAQTIDGSSTYTLSTSLNAVRFFSDGANWFTY